MGNLAFTTIFIFSLISLFVYWGLTHAYPGVV